MLPRRSPGPPPLRRRPLRRMPVSPDVVQEGAAAVSGGALDDVEVVLCDADGNLFPSEEPAFVASTEVTNDLMGAYGSDRRFTPEELRLATTGLIFRSTAVVLCLDNGIRVARDLLPPDRSPANDDHEGDKGRA